MLGKLIKYEFKATGRIFLPLYAAILIFAIINNIFIQANAIDFANGIFQGIGVTIFVSLIVAVFVLSFYITLSRFYKNLLGDEGYLMFTLPVKPIHHIMSKMIVANVWLVLSGIITMFAIFFLFVDAQVLSAFPSFFAELFKAIPRVFAEYPDIYHVVLYCIEFFILSIISLFANTIMFYLAIAIGHTANKHKILFSFAAYMGITVILQSAVTLLIPIGNLDFVWSFANGVSTITGGHLVLIGMILSTSALFAICTYLTNYILNKKLNLE